MNVKAILPDVTNENAKFPNVIHILWRDLNLISWRLVISFLA